MPTGAGRAYQLGLEEAGFHPTFESREVSPEDSQSSYVFTAANVSYNARFRALESFEKASTRQSGGSIINERSRRTHLRTRSACKEAK
jgi:hypothetical protein